MLIQEYYFRNIFNTVRGPILILDENLRVLSANRSFFTTFKVDAAITIGTLLYDLGNGQWNIPHLRVLLEDVLPNNDTVDDYEIVHDFESIGQKTMLLNACKLREKLDDQPIILLAIEDITERKRLEELLTESEERYRRIFETASDGILLLEKREGTISHVNPSAEKMMGYSEEECNGKKLQDIGVSIDMSDFPAIMHSLNKSGILNYEDVSVKTKSGQDIYTDIYMVDRAVLAQCNIRDVSERKLAEEALKKEKAFIENALNALVDIFFVCDLEGRFLRWNTTLRDVTGYSDNEIAVMQPTDFFRDEDIARVAKAIRKVVKEGRSTVEALVVTKDGRQISYELRASQLLDHTENLIGISGVGTDLTARRKLEVQLLHSQKMEAVGTLAGGVAHDFNNILQVIIGYGSMVQEKLAAGSPEKEQQAEVLAAADRAATLTKRLLLFSRKQVAEVKLVNINELIISLQKMLVRVIRENIDFKLNLADSPLLVLADAGLIEQVLMNLATNARDAMLDGGSLTISTERAEVDMVYVAAYGYGTPGKFALITVTDTGQGIDPETQKKKSSNHFLPPRTLAKEQGLAWLFPTG